MGLEAAHAAGLVHRDVKPDNVFVIGDPQRSTEVKLLDFGIAKATEEEEALTREGAVLGTVYFMSPEQTKSSVGADARSDVYSMGATLYRALTGVYPVEPGPTVSVVAKIVTGHVSRHPREVLAAVPSWLDAVVARAMAPRPEDRYASAREMREALAMGAAPGVHRGRRRRELPAGRAVPTRVPTERSRTASCRPRRPSTPDRPRARSPNLSAWGPSVAGTPRSPRSPAGLSPGAQAAELGTVGRRGRRAWQSESSVPW